MKKFLVMALATMMMTVVFTSCSASDDDMSGVTSSYSSVSDFSLISFSKSTATPVGQEGTENTNMNEKLVCKVLPGGKLMITHKNVIFDEDADIKFTTDLVGNKLIITEKGNYGKSGKYGYFTLVATVGIVKDGDYVIVVKRNDHVREEFKMTYDSSKAK